MTTKHILVDRGDPSGYDWSVGSLTCDGNYHDLDCSSIVPAGATYIQLQVVCNASSTYSIRFRKNGNSDVYASQIVIAASPNSEVIIVPCDTSRVIEYRATNGSFTAIDITVLGWIVGLTETKLVELPQKVTPALDDVVYTTNGSSDKKVEIADVNMGLVLLEELTESNVSSIDMENWYSYKYDEYLVEVFNLQVLTDTANLRLRVSTDGGSSYASSGYDGSIDWWYATGTSREAQSSTQGNLTNGGSGISTGTYYSVSGRIEIYDPANTSLYKNIRCKIMYPYSSGFVQAQSIIVYESTSAVNAFQIYASSGNVSGTVRVYGIRRTYTTTTTTTTT